jgi:hypothetical protein
MIKKLLITYVLPIIFFMMLTLSISYKVLPNTWAIAHNDWAYYFNIDSKKDYQKSVYTDDYLGTDLSSIVFLHLIKANVVSWLKSLWIHDNYVSYIITFWLAFICSLLYYFIFFNISWNRLFWYFAGIFVIFNNLSIWNIYFGLITFHYLALIWFWLLILFLSIEHKNITISKLIFLILLSLSFIIPIYLVIYLIILSLFFIYTKRVRILFLLIPLILLIQSYWIFPFIINLLFSYSENIYNWNAENVFNWYKNISTYLNVMNLRQYFNLISLKLNGSLLAIFWPILLVISIIFLYIKNNFNIKKKQMLFFFILYFIFFNISLWPNSYITGTLWVYLWDNYSIFHFFRSFTRFLIILVPLLLIMLSLVSKRYKHINKFLYFLIGIFIFSNTALISWNLSWNLNSLKLTDSIFTINNINIDKRSLVLPNNWYESYTWTNWPDIKQVYFLSENIFNFPIVLERESLNLKKQNLLFSKIFKNQTYDDLYLDIQTLGVSYVLLSKKSVNIFNGKIIWYKPYEDYLETHFIKIFWDKYFSIYKINNVKPKIYWDNKNVHFSQISSVKYKVNIKNLNIDKLYFLNNFNNKWKIYAWKDNIEKKYSYSDISYLFEKDYFSNTHKKYNDFANSWALNKKVILDNFPEWFYSKNSDWTINVDLVLYYIPQAYYYIWKLLSWAILVLLIILYLFTYFRRKNEK